MPTHRRGRLRPIVVNISDSAARDIVALLRESVGFLLQRGAHRCEDSGMDAAESPAVAPAPGAVTPVNTSTVTIEQAAAGWRDSLSSEGCACSTIDIYRRNLERVAAAAGWKTTADIRLEHVTAFLASRIRNDHGGRAWTPNTVRQTVAALTSFTDFCRANRLIPADPLADLRSPKRIDGPGKHAFTTDEARRLILAAVTRHARIARTPGHAPLIWYTMFSTGLRHEEVGQVLWGDLSLEGELPGLRLRLWPGNKARRRDWLPIRERLRGLLLEHARTVPSSAGDPVFPMVATKDTWHKDRGAAGLPERDEDGQLYSPHATRASFITWLGQRPEIPEGMRQRLARHKSLTETTYTGRGKAELSEAITLLPEIWPETLPAPRLKTRGAGGDNGSGSGSSTPLNRDEVREESKISLDDRRNVSDAVSCDAGIHFNPHGHEHAAAPASQPRGGGRAWAGGPAGHDVDSSERPRPETPVSSLGLIEAVLTDFLRSQAFLRSWLAGNLPSEGSLRHGDGQRHERGEG